MAKQEPDKKLVKVTMTMQDIWDASKHLVHKSKKTYTRKGRKKNESGE